MLILSFLPIFALAASTSIENLDVEEYLDQCRGEKPPGVPLKETSFDLDIFLNLPGLLFPIFYPKVFAAIVDDEKCTKIIKMKERGHKMDSELAAGLVTELPSFQTFKCVCQVFQIKQLSGIWNVPLQRAIHKNLDLLTDIIMYVRSLNVRCTEFESSIFRFFVAEETYLTPTKLLEALSRKGFRFDYESLCLIFPDTAKDTVLFDSLNLYGFVNDVDGVWLSRIKDFGIPITSLHYERALISGFDNNILQVQKILGDNFTSFRTNVFLEETVNDNSPLVHSVFREALVAKDEFGHQRIDDDLCTKILSKKPGFLLSSSFD